MAIDPDFQLASYDYALPEENIAQQPASRRDASRLLVLDCGPGPFLDRNFADICDFLAPGDLLVVNDTRVFPARLLGRKESGGRVELLILEYPLAVSQGAAGEGAEEAWREPSLLAECPHCRLPLKYNPFIVDRRELLPAPADKKAREKRGGFFKRLFAK